MECKGTPSKGDFFTYEAREYITNGEGGYADYNEEMKSSGRYEIVEVVGDEAIVHYSWSWTYTSDTEPTAHASRDDRISFSRTTGEYISGFDLDENIPGRKNVWFWINPDVEIGDMVKILDKYYEVTGTRVTIWSKYLPRTAIELTYYGTFRRDDTYGRFTATYTDKFYMDIETGYIIAERYEEHDEGYSEGYYSEFDWIFEFDTIDSSYDRNLDYLLFSGVYILFPLCVIGLIYGVYYYVRWAPRRVTTMNYSDLVIQKQKKGKPLPTLCGRTSQFFEPFIEDMINKAHTAGDRVAVATYNNYLIGLAIYHKDATENLRKYIGTKDFFSEVRHKPITPPNYFGIYGAFGYASYGYPKIPSAEQDAYNIYETHKILVKENIEPEAYDSSIIRIMKKEDLPAVCELSKKVYRIKGEKWFNALLKHGDLGLVAVIDGKIVGFAFATLVNEYARLHSLTVDPAYRSRGIGKELSRARLNMLSS
ncbi:MAG: GNAT family N-acetyltransferase, partial [Thermoplasmata archaeon]